MCNTHSHGQAHGVRSDSEKVMADLRDDLVEELKLINKYEAQIPVVAVEDFPQVDAVVQMLVEVRDGHKAATASLIRFLNQIDAEHAASLDGHAAATHSEEAHAHQDHSH